MIINPLAIILGVCFVIVVLVYYFFIERPAKIVTEQNKKSHYHEDGFIVDAKLATFEYYEAKFTKIVVVLIVLCVPVIALPSQTIPWPYSILITLLGMGFVVMLLAFMNKDIREKELTDASDKEFMLLLSYHRNKGFIPLFVRRTKLVSEVVLGKAQKEYVIDRAIKTIQNMKEFRDGDLKIQDFRKVLEKRLEDIHCYRLEAIGDYRILFITNSSYEALKSPTKVSVIDKTMAVSVSLIPAFGIFCDSTPRTFKTIGKNGKIEYDDRKMGIYLDVFNLDMFRQIITEGKFDAPDKVTALMGQFVHLVEQQGWEGSEMTKEVRAREKAQLISRTQKFNNQADANAMVNTTEHILKLILAIVLGRVRSIDDAEKYVIGMFIGAVVMYVLLALAGRLTF